jgi:hypothetical protein
MEKCTVSDFEGFDQNLCHTNRSDKCPNNDLTHRDHHSIQTKQCFVNTLLMNSIVKRVRVCHTTGVVNRDSAVL